MATIAAKLRRASVSAMVLLFAGGCAEQAFVFVPVTNATATLGGQEAARYLIPPEAPRGEVRVASFGVVDIEQPRRSGEFAALHVQLAVSNDTSAKDWSVDVRQIRTDLRGIGDAGVPMASIDSSGQLPRVVIPPGETRTINLFYPLPEGADDEDVPAFDVVWRVYTDARVVQERTPFERIEIDKPATEARVTVVAGVWAGRTWWYDPWYFPPRVVVRPMVMVPTRAMPPPRVRVRHHAPR